MPCGAAGATMKSPSAPHRDAETFAQTRNNLTDWIAGGPGTVVNAAKGRTATNARLAAGYLDHAARPQSCAGVRYEDWRAYAGTNFSASPALNVSQPRISASTLSPKASLAWQVSDTWRLTGSWGVAYRMPTVTELYQAITTGTTLTVPNPNLKPERASSYELAAEYRTGQRPGAPVPVRGRHRQRPAVAVGAAGGRLHHPVQLCAECGPHPGARAGIGGRSV